MLAGRNQRQLRWRQQHQGCQSGRLLTLACLAACTALCPVPVMSIAADIRKIVAAATQNNLNDMSMGMDQCF